MDDGKGEKEQVEEEAVHEGEDCAEKHEEDVEDEHGNEQ